MKTDLFRNMSSARRGLILLVIIYVGFISLGLPDTILGVAWDKMHVDFGTALANGGLITTMLTLCSAVSSFCSGMILRRLGTGRLLMVCGYITGISLLGYAFSPYFFVLLLCTVPLGFGQGAVDTGMNFYVAKHYSSRVMNWLHCCWGLGATLGPVIAGFYLEVLKVSWKWAYITVGSIQVILATVFLLTLSLWNQDSKSSGSVEEIRHGDGKVRRDLRFWLCALSFYVYTGIEITPGLWGFMFLTQQRGVSGEAARFWIACYWGGLMLGRFLIGIFANHFGNRFLIRASLVGVMAGAVLLMLPYGGALPPFALMLTGFSLAAIYPCMMHEAPRRFDDVTASSLTGYQGGAAMLGVASVPAVFGFIATRSTFEFLPYMVVTGAVLILLMQLRVDGFRLKR